MSDVTVSVKQLDPDIPLPTYAYEGDGAVDLSSAIDVVIAPGARAKVATGLAVSIPRGYAGLVIPRSGLAAKHGISVVNAPGLIDSGYRGEIQVILLNTDLDNAFEVRRGDRIAQLAIVPMPSIRFQEVDELDESARSERGFGSSGV